MSQPRHVNPPKGTPVATAPYNFVPLPERVLTAEQALGPRVPLPWQAHDRYLPDTHHGWIDLTIETLTPLFIRGPVQHDEQGGWDQREARLRPDPWTTLDGRPVIPGSSLRGMLRTLTEILTYAKLTPVNDAKPFYRTVAGKIAGKADRITKAYGNRLVRGDAKPDGGFLRHHDGAWSVQPAEAVLRVSHELLARRWPKFAYPPQPRGDTYKPRWPTDDGLQYQACWVRRHGTTRRVADICLGARPDGGEWLAGTLVLTGTAPNKKAEFVFLTPTRTAPPVEVPEAVWERFHDDDQLTQWQERAFPPDQPTPGARPAAGHLADGEPVFFVHGPEGTVEFLGRAGMFRFPYDRSLHDLTPEELREGPLDLAEAIFGYVPGGGGPRMAVKGRVFVEDAVAADTPGGWFEQELVPRILSSPKPTTFSHYLTQDGRQGVDRRTTYLRGDDTTVRGHKLYWHRWDDHDGLAVVAETDQARLREELRVGTDTQHTLIRPVRAGVAFTGRVRFENLSDVELGALLASVGLPEGCAHKLGMGKPLGLGSVHLTPRLQLIDRRRRYRSWADQGVMDRPATDEIEARCRRGFETTILGHARASGEPLLDGRAGLAKVARLDALYTMLQWDPTPGQRPGRPQPTQTAYIDEPKQFTQRKVLPTPHRVANLDEPPWPEHPPQPARDEPDALARRTRGQRPKRPSDRNVPQGRRGARTPPSRPRPSAQGPAPTNPTPAPSGKGTVVRCRALEERTKKGGWVFLLPDGRQGVLHPHSQTPPDLVPGQELDLRIESTPSGSGRFQLRWLGPGAASG
jgi:CRISPR-associated protein (TIGR03986 family)